MEITFITLNAFMCDKNDFWYAVTTCLARRAQKASQTFWLFTFSNHSYKTT